MPNSEIPLHLFQVLEEEYLSLHGALSPRETVRLRDRPADIVSELDWKFREGHVKNGARLAHKLTPCTGAHVRDDLAAHFGRVSPAYRARREAATNAAGVNSAAPELTGALNELLRVWIYDPNAFKYVNLSDPMRVLLRHHAHAAPDSDELAHVNRLLLEETFPDELERLSDIRLAAMYQRLHTHSSAQEGGAREYGQAAVCLSGGGIRSGTFALGVLQGLARHNLLARFDYLSTVSGGGYIGGWLTAWLHRHPRALAGVTSDLSTVDPKSKIDPDPPAVQYLREYSNFLTPKTGVLTADTWAFVAIYLRNLLLNWTVLFPLLLALLALPRLNLSLLLAQGGTESFLGFWFAERYLFLAAGSALLVLALTYIIVSRPAVSAKITERSRFWRGRRDQRHFLRWCLLPLVGSVYSLTTYWAWSVEAHEGAQPEGRVWRFVGFGVVVTLAAWVVSAVSLERFTRPKEMGKLELAELAMLLLIGAGGGAALFYTSQSIGGRLAAGRLAGPVKSLAFEWYAVGGVPLLLLVILLLTTLFIGFTSKGFFGLPEPLNDEDREWWARFTAWVLIAMLVWAAFGLISLHGPRLVFWFPEWIASVGGISGLVALVASYSAKTPANEEQAKKGGLLKTFLRDQVLPLLALVFLLAFAVALAFLVTALLHAAALLVSTTLPALQPMREGYDYTPSLDDVAHSAVVHYSRLWFVAAFIAASAALGLLLASRINLNKFSLHAGYRNRLIRGFLGASRDRNLRRPNPFTGFDPEDNVHMHELRPALFHEGDFTDLEGLAVEIGRAAGEDTLAGRLHSWLERETQLELESYEGGTQLPPRLRINLIEDLNSVLEDECVVNDPEAGDGRPQLARRPEPVPQDDGSVLAKRAVLQSAFPDKIVAKYPPPHRLLHVVNTALNLVGGKKLAWQQRKAEPFAFTPLHCGSFRIGYRRSRHYGGQRGVSLGTAAAISGAAASSNMGYYTTSPVLSMILTLFNVRLGWWLGNPGPAGDTTYHREAPLFSLAPVIEEAFGLTDDTNPYVYLTDGGHFENLALYEMILRRCRLIVLSDAAEDGDFKFNDLGNAVRKIRIDLGVPIEFEEMRILKQKPGQDDDDKTYGYWAFGRIEYSKVDKIRVDEKTIVSAPDGLLIYVKPAVYGDAEPRDVLQYKAANEDFPHQSTGDQFFDEPQFESYRRLGLYIMENLCAGAKGDLNREQLVTWALKNYPGARPPWLEKLLDPTSGVSWLA